MSGFNSHFRAARIAGISSSSNLGQGGYEFTGAFVDRTTGQSGANDLGSNVEYTQTLVSNKRWLRFGFSSARQLANDVEYWGETDPNFDQAKGLFGGLHMPRGVNNLFDFSDTSLGSAVETGDLQYTAANGSYDFTECRVGDLAKVRFSFNFVPQQPNTTLEVGLIFATRNPSDVVTFTFPLTTQPLFFGLGSVGESYLCRVEISAYFASDEDINSRSLAAIRSDQPCLIQPLTTLCTIVR